MFDSDESVAGVAFRSRASCDDVVVCDSGVSNAKSCALSFLREFMFLVCQCSMRG